MTYTPTNISTRNIDTDEKELRPQLLKANLDLIAQETKVLGNNINAVKTEITSVKKELSVKLTPLVASLLFG